MSDPSHLNLHVLIGVYHEMRMDAIAPVNRHLGDDDSYLCFVRCLARNANSSTSDTFRARAQYPDAIASEVDDRDRQS